MAHPVAGAAAVALLLVSAWGASAPLDLWDSGNGWGADLPRGEARLFGLWLPPTEVPVVLDGARLVEPRGVEAAGTWVVPVEAGMTGVGVTEAPPVDLPAWDDRVSLEGAVLLPGRQYQVVLALRLVPTADAGTTDGVVLAYHAGGRSYSTTSRDHYELRTS